MKTNVSPVLTAALALTISGGLKAEEPPVIPVGLDAYRQWECWPYQRIGARAYMRSTYDRTGGNGGADASHFLYEVDGVDHLIQETSSPNPNNPAPNSVFLPEEPFPNPLTWTWSMTKGADLSWIPIPFEKSFRMAYSRTHYGTGYYIYHQYVRGAKLSQLIRAWDGRTPPDKDVLQLIARAGTDICPPDAT